MAIIGLGYVGLPLAVEFASAGLVTTGVDLSEEKVAQVNAGESYIADVPSAEVRGLVEAGMLGATTDAAALGEVDCICISVPTPLSKTKDPDISYIVAACDMIVEHFRSGVLIVLESTTYPGTAEEVILSRLDAGGRWSARISSLPSRPSASTPATRSGRPATPRRSSAA